MSKDDPLKNWQLEEGGEPLDQWKLQDAEQQIDKNMQLQPAAQTPSDWQPVEYQRPATRSGRNWVLPSIVIVALLVALGYVGFVSLNRFGLGEIQLGPLSMGAAAETPTAEPTVATEEAPPVAVVAETPTVEPTATPEPPTATPEPTPPPALITMRIASVNEEAGVNARRAPSTDSEIVRLLNNGEQTTLAGTEGDWLQVILSDEQVAYVSSEFMNIGVGDQVTLEAWNA
ncbi:MAG: SH3 domain-containing protein, partial [Caldilineaceae bacterium]|nr:SH3 domain-containing protein [Caldilineaceae bacterium]